MSPTALMGFPTLTPNPILTWLRLRVTLKETVAISFRTIPTLTASTSTAAMPEPTSDRDGPEDDFELRQNPLELIVFLDKDSCTSGFPGGTAVQAVEDFRRAFGAWDNADKG